ncbi:MAG: AraC family transcriptional regulator [Prevotellaceae bacterium]|jgi:AraC-like DNA-binding protein|nr:AraC family transcriptional regulator [Prevotellaceae bacterium]
MEQLLNKKEHLECYMYDNKDDSIIKYINKSKGEICIANGDANQIIFLIKGKITFSYGNYLHQNFTEGTFMLFPQRYKCVLKFETDSVIVVFNMGNKVDFCKHFSLETLSSINKNIAASSELHPLQVNKIISHYLDNLIKSEIAGLKCLFFHELKLKELFFYLRIYYPKKDLFSFFAPILNDDFVFSELIYSNFDKIKNVGELAAITDYSLSGFKKRFIRIFRISPYQWIMKEKAKKIYHEINCTQKSFKEISGEYGFSSPAHFDKFCKQQFGTSPGTIRHNNKANILDF